MTFKLFIGYDDGGGAGRILGGGCTEFQVLEDAQSAAQAWRSTGNGRIALLWDGSTWTTYV